jgi:hypothetical protein
VVVISRFPSAALEQARPISSLKSRTSRPSLFR